MLPNFSKNKKSSVFNGLLFKIGAIFIFLAIILMVIADIKIYRKKRQLDSQIESLKNKIQSLENNNKALREGIASADDSEYIEKIAREELNLQKPGEKVISFVVDEKETDGDNSKREGFFQNLIDWVSGLFKRD